ncbi:MAG: hypothetical protein QOG01_697 [Pseudonocardiales bacterium]|nr:hypothetical protein [Pseudonocardiales bacterium]
MAPTVTPSPPGTPSLDVHDVLDPLWHGLWTGVTSSPWTVLGFAVFVFLVGIQFVHSVAHPKTNRDPIRRFSRTDKAVILRRAGGRCEHHGWITRRCSRTEQLEADHVHPHSRGGQTAIANGQALCRVHNRLKRATIPFNWQLRGLAKRRALYFPLAEDPVIVRHRPHPKRPTRRTRRTTQQGGGRVDL